MTSYITFVLPKRVKGGVQRLLVPIKVGGYTGKTEPSVGVTKTEQRALDRQLIGAAQAHDEVLMVELEKRIFKTAVKDVQTGYLAWFPHTMRNLVPKDTTKLIYLDSKGKEQWVKVRVGDDGKPMIRDWQVSKPHPSLAVWLDGMPFAKYSYQEVAYMIDAAVRLFDRYTLDLHERKVRAARFPAEVKPTARGMSGEVRARKPGKHKIKPKTYRKLTDGTRQVWVEKDTADGKGGYWRDIGKVMK